MRKRTACAHAADQGGRSNADSTETADFAVLTRPSERYRRRERIAWRKRAKRHEPARDNSRLPTRGSRQSPSSPVRQRMREELWALPAEEWYRTRRFRIYLRSFPLWSRKAYFVSVTNWRLTRAGFLRERSPGQVCWTFW